MASKVLAIFHSSPDDPPEPSGNILPSPGPASGPVWRQNLERWKRSGGDHGYHYLGSAIWFNRLSSRQLKAEAGAGGLGRGLESELAAEQVGPAVGQGQAQADSPGYF